MLHENATRSSDRGAERPGNMDAVLEGFSQFAGRSADLMGSASAFVIATVACLLWAVSGPYFDYSDTWQLVINTATTVLTFLAVFLIQHTQNKEGKAIQLKLDELIRSNEQARNALIDLEHCSEADFTQNSSRVRAAS